MKPLSLFAPTRLSDISLAGRVTRWMLLATTVLLGYAIGLAQEATRPSLPSRQYPAGQLVGSVVDSASGGAISNVILRLYAETESKPQLLAYTITKDNGTFELKIPATQGRLYCEASLMGYKTQQVPILPPYKAMTIRLAESNIVFEDLVVQGHAIRSRGDTVIFRADEFATANTHSLEDLIKKIPGITVTSTGGIQWQGEGIAGIQIEDLDLMGGRYRTVSQTLHAEAVRAIEVIERHQPIKAKQGVELGKKAMLNVRLKNKNMLHPSGSITPTLGAREGKGPAYGIEVTTLLVNAHTQILGVAGLNNAHLPIAHEAFHRDGAISTSARRLLPSLQSPSAPVREAIESRHMGGTINQIFRNGQHGILRYNAGYGDTRQQTMSAVEAQLFDGDDGYISYLQEQSRTTLNRQAHINIHYEHNAPAKHIGNSLYLQTEWFKSLRHIRRDGVPIDETGRTRELRLVDRFTLVRRQGDRKLLDFSLALRYSTLPVSTIYVPEGTYSFVQHTGGSNARVQTDLGYSWILGKRTSLATKLILDGGWVEVEAWGVPTAPTALAKGLQLSPTLTTSLDYLADKLRWSIGIPLEGVLEHFRYTSIEGERRTHSARRLSPGFVASMFYSPSAYLKGNANLSYKRGYTYDITNFVFGTIRTSYDALRYRTQLVLPHEWGLRGSVNVEYKRPVRGFFWRGQLDGSISETSTMISREVSSTGTTSTIEERSGRVQSVHLFSIVSQYSYALKSTFSLTFNAQHSNRPQLESGRLSKLYMNHWSVMPKVNFNAIPGLEISAAGQYARQRSRIGALDHSSSQLSLFSDLSLALGQRWTASVSHELSSSRQASERLPTSSFVDASVGYQLSRWRFDLRLQNVLNAREQNLIHYLQSDIHTSVTHLRPRQITLSVYYKY